MKWHRLLILMAVISFALLIAPTAGAAPDAEQKVLFVVVDNGYVYNDWQHRVFPTLQNTNADATVINLLQEGQVATHLASRFLRSDMGLRSVL